MKQSHFREKANAVLSLLLRLLKHLFLHNGWIKLIAVIISLILWAGLISQDESITRNKTFQNVNVSSTIESLNNKTKNNGYIITSDLSELLSNVTLTVAVPQTRYENATESFFTVQIDENQIKGTGTQELKLTGTNSTLYGKVVSINPASITVDVENYIEAPFGVNLFTPNMSMSIRDNTYYHGWYKDWYIYVTKNTVSDITVSGPESLVNSINRTRVILDPETNRWEEGAMSTTETIQLIDTEGKIIENPLLKIKIGSVTSNRAIIRFNVLPTKTFDTKELIQITGEPPEGYKIGKIETRPETISIAAGSDVLNELTTLQTDHIIDISAMTENNGRDKVTVIKPTDDSVLSNSTISVNIELIPDEE